MQTEHHGEVRHHPKNRHLAERAETWIQIAMVVAVVILGIGLIYGMVNGGSTPSWMP
jgi:hypothetical protein